MDHEPQHEPPIDWSDVEAANRRHQQAKADYVARLRQIGQEIDATPVAIWIIPPGVAFRPVVYQRHSDNACLLLVGLKGQVAGTEDTEAERAAAPMRVDGKTETLADQYVVLPFDLAASLREGSGFYTLEGYPERRPYNPETDPPLIAEPDR